MLHLEGLNAVAMLHTSVSVSRKAGREGGRGKPFHSSAVKAGSYLDLMRNFKWKPYECVCVHLCEAKLYLKRTNDLL